MIRRHFITLLGGAAAAWPFVVRAQQSERIRRIGVLMPVAEEDSEGRARVGGLVDGLREIGLIEGRNLKLEVRWGSSDVERLREYASELIGLAPEVLLAGSTPGLAALHRATANIPIVFVLVSDPVGQGYVQSLAHPGGNVTGFTSFEFSAI